MTIHKLAQARGSWIISVLHGLWTGFGQVHRECQQL